MVLKGDWGFSTGFRGFGPGAQDFHGLPARGQGFRCFYKVFMDFTVSLHFHGFSWFFTVFNGFSQFFTVFTGFPRFFFLVFPGFSRFSLDFHGFIFFTVFTGLSRFLIVVNGFPSF